MSRYNRDWLETHVRQIALETATYALQEKEHDLRFLHQRKLDLELHMQRLHLDLVARNEKLMERREATAEAIAADKLYAEDSYSEDEYVMGRKVDKITVAAVKKAMRKEALAGYEERSTAAQLAEATAKSTVLQTLIEDAEKEVKDAELALEMANAKG